jgi:acetylglutamate kinase
MGKVDTATAKASVLIEALPYIQDFNGSVVLIKLGGSVMEIEENLDSLMDDVAFMGAVGIKVVIVHGGGKAISRAIKESGHEPQFVGGLRVTDEKTMEIVRHTLNNVVNPDLVSRLQKRRTNARPLHGNWIFGARKIAAPDRGYVGEVVSVDTRAVCEMLDAGIVPVVTPLGTGVDDAHLYNINADFAAAALAKELKVRKFALVSDVPGLLRDPEDPATLLSTLHLGDMEALKADGTISGGMLPKITSCEDAIRAGVRKVHLVDGRMAHSLLLEIFTREGVGTEMLQ